jgi:hypothetical protein
MKRLVLGIVVAAVVLYLWGFLVWGLGPYRTAIWKKPADEAAARKVLKEQFPENGTYYVPSFGQEQAVVEEFKQGPVAMVHMLADPSIMIGGFVLNLVALVLIALILQRVASAMPGYGQRVGFVALIGLTAALLCDGGDAVWWQIPWSWKLYQAGYDFSFWLIAGLILPRFVEAKRA